MEIRFYEKEDLKELIKLEVKSNIVSNKSLAKNFLEYHLFENKQITSPNSKNCFILKENEEIKAFLSFIIIKEKKATINYVKNYDNKKDYGKKLIEYTLNYLKSINISLVNLQAISKVHQRYYEKLGFEIESTLENGVYLMKREI